MISQPFKDGLRHFDKFYTKESNAFYDEYSLFLSNWCIFFAVESNFKKTLMFMINSLLKDGKKCKYKEKYLCIIKSISYSY